MSENRSMSQLLDESFVLQDEDLALFARDGTSKSARIEDITNVPNGLVRANDDGEVPAIVLHRTGTASEIDEIVLSVGELAITTDTLELRIGDGETPGGRTSSIGSSSTVVVQAHGNAVENGTTLRAAYDYAATLTPNGAALSSTNRSTVLVMPGHYDMDGDWNLTHAYVNLIGLGGSRSTFITGQTRQQNVEMKWKGFTINTTLSGILLPDGLTDNNYWEDLVFAGAQGPMATFATGDGTSDHTLRGKYIRIRNTSSGSAFFTPGLQSGVTLAATFEDFEAYGSKPFSILLTVGQPTFTGTIKRFTYLGSASNFDCTMNGTIEDSDLKLLRISRLGSNNRIYNTRIAPASATPINHNAAVDGRIAHCRLKDNSAGGIGSNVTNLIGTPYNVIDDDV